MEFFLLALIRPIINWTGHPERDVGRETHPHVFTDRRP